MTITREADYALRILTILAIRGELTDAGVISEHIGVPYRFTLKILHKLVCAELVHSVRGTKGGYALKAAPEDITFFDVINVIDGPVAVNKCLKESGLCQNNGLCEIQKRLNAVQDVLFTELRRYTIGEVAEALSEQNIDSFPTATLNA